MSKPTIVKTPDDVLPVSKQGFDLNKFKSKRAAAAANVDTLQTGLSILKLAEAGDFIRLHPDEENYWSPELCFVNVPIKGQKKDTLHLIDEDLAMEFLPSGRIIRHRLALAMKATDAPFLAVVPSRNFDNEWNSTCLTGCEKAKTLWVMVSSRLDEGVQAYKVDFARDPDVFGDPKWPTQSLNDLLERTFNGRVIDREDHPGLLRLIGAKQNLA